MKKIKVDEWESLVMVICGHSDVAEPSYIIQGHPHEKEKHRKLRD